MLEELYLKNFQKHKSRRIPLNQPVTTLVGRTESGKSAIIRALWWLTWNRPLHDGFIRQGSPYALATLRIDGHTITRRKGKKGNEYLLDGQVFKAIRGDVPDAIAQILNVGAVNYNRQHDSPWWFDLTAGEVSKELNAIVNLGSIDRTASALATELRTAKATVTVTTNRLAQAETRQQALGWVPAALAAWEGVEVAQTRLAEKKRSLGRLDALLGALQTAGERRKTAQAQLPVLARAVAAGERLLEVRKQLFTLNGLLAELAELKAAQQRALSEQEAITKQVNTVLRAGCPLCGKK